MFVNNFMAPIQVRLSPNFVSHTLGHRKRGNQISEGQESKVKVGGGGMRSTERLSSCYHFHKLHVVYMKP